MKFHFLKSVLLVKKSITSSEEDKENPIRFYISNQDQGARKMLHALSCHELQSLFWEISQRLGIFRYKQNYISFLKLSDNWNASNCSIFFRPKCDARWSQVTTRGLGFTFHSPVELPPFRTRIKTAISSDLSNLSQASHAWISEGFFLYPTEPAIFSAWR